MLGSVIGPALTCTALGTVMPVSLLRFLLVRGAQVRLLAPPGPSPGDRRALTLCASPCLPLVVTITTIGADRKVIGGGRAAALVGAAMVAVLILPLLASRLRGGGRRKERASVSSAESQAW
ncbi:hypothetical protein CF54_29400 [Streptomyces sp. Tu 6176]|uniref:hypothetical protein n=1 Tax=Streptomyces sp. Tu 6176 TaxID=1470557 RepID=UPI000446A634|nr:hypothetical protein [Streptomyces sp. Tu 6176]EYT79762.1 hypothetical protein CF54_29400 [Streptomyces sp. Tu 6176]